MTRTTVELTRVHFYDPGRSERNLEIPSVSRDVFRYDLHRSPIIKKNIFGHRWVLKINENQEDAKAGRWINAKVIVYVWVFCCIVVAVGFGVYFSIESKYFPERNATSERNTTVLPNRTTVQKPPTIPNMEFIEDDRLDVHKFLILSPYDVTTRNEENPPSNKESVNLTTTTQTASFLLCDDCILDEEICLKTEEFHKPICVKIRDSRDPSGCGGLCELNTQHCKRLHTKIAVFQCAKNGNILRCRSDSFSCGNMCIPRYNRCDGVVHCSNMADEKNCECDMNSYFHCGNATSCIEKNRRCNGVIDCWDKSDETDCHRECQLDEEPCANGECIKKEHFCDGIYHCTDKSDEPQGC